ncbi:hypothetical protein UlMin_024495 [Ulmus minor]
MEFPAISPSKSFHFPANFPGKHETHFHILLRKTSLRCKTRRVRVAHPAFNENNSSISVSTASTDQSDQESISFNNGKDWIHFVGIGGCGLSALAMLALKQGYEVSGSDIEWNSSMDRLQEAGARLHIGHSVTNMQGNTSSRLPNAVVISSAIPQNNMEILYAKSVGVPVYKRDYWLGKLTQHYKLIAVSGSHGKSTTSGMLAYVLNAMGGDLAAVIGAQVPQLSEGNIISGGSETFVLEADEYDGCFLKLSPYIAVVTNVDWEHVDIFQDEEAVKTTFRRFLNQIRKDGHLIICGDREGAYSLLNHCKQATNLDASEGAISIPSSEPSAYRITTYGITNSNEWHASSIRQNSIGGCDYTLCHRGCPVADISLQIPGIHNVLNSLAVIATVITAVGSKSNLYDTIHHLRLHLQGFRGVSRRFEMIGSIYGCQIFDDYAHHPTEVCAVLQAARQRFPLKSLLVVFQPHTYSRLAALKDEFSIALSCADQVVVTGVYAARDADYWNVSGKTLSDSIIGLPCEYIPSLGDVVDKLAYQVCEDPYRDIVILTLGAGDITTVGRKLLKRLQRELLVNS